MGIAFWIVVGVLLFLIILGGLIAKAFEKKPEIKKPHPHEIHRLADDGCPLAEPSPHCEDYVCVKGDVKSLKWVEDHIPFASGEGMVAVASNSHVDMEVGFGSDVETHIYCVYEDTKI